MMLNRFWQGGWGFDWLYDKLFIRPFVWLTRANKEDVIDSLYDGIAGISRIFYSVLSDTQTGNVRWYMTGIAFGGVIAIAIVLLMRNVL
jgi:NADH-quinone oxidoreductase subunit L